MWWRKKLKYSLALACVAGLVACGDDLTVPGTLEEGPSGPSGFSVSEPVGLGGGTSALASRLQGLVYVSASPGTFPDGVSAQVTNLATGESVTTPIEDGGFDPITIAGSPGDELEIRVQNSDGTIDVFRVRVPKRKKPKVVRTRPPAGQTDVVLNSTVIVVFSEPVDSSSINRETIDLRGDGGPVAGTVTLDEDGLRAELTPAAALTLETTYTLTIRTGIHDLAGDAPEEEVVVSFTTQASVASVTIDPNELAITPTQQVQLLATLKDAAGNTLVGREVTWSSSDDGIASVDANGLVTGIALGSATITAISEGVSGTVTVTVQGPDSFAQVSTWDLHSCALMISGEAWCWGHATEGALGIGGSLPGGDVLTPAPVQGGLQFATLSVGSLHTCAVTTSGEPYCWGYNLFGNLGDGDFSGSSKFTPVPVVGGFNLTVVSSGNHHSCGVASGGAGYCWGSDYSGELGDGGDIYFDHGSVRVAGGLRLASLEAGAVHTCGITTSGNAYCWGWSGNGQLGIGLKDVTKTVPFRVVGGLTFASVSAGGRHTCGITTGGETYCWGDNEFGQLGTQATTEMCGLEPCSSTPLPFSGGPTFASISAGGYHTCGITSDGEAYCWGDNEFGQLGDGTTRNSTGPALVSGGLTFSSISTGWTQTCGVTASGEAYCWGQNHHGQLGNASLTDSSIPVRVAQ